MVSVRKFPTVLTQFVNTRANWQAQIINYISGIFSAWSGVLCKAQVVVRANIDHVGLCASESKKSRHYYRRINHATGKSSRSHQWFGPAKLLLRLEHRKSVVQKHHVHDCSNFGNKSTRKNCTKEGKTKNLE
jgi:hypothetical protein